MSTLYSNLRLGRSLFAIFVLWSLATRPRRTQHVLAQSGTIDALFDETGRLECMLNALVPTHLNIGSLTGDI